MSGHHVLLTRPEGSNEVLAAMLEKAGYAVTIRPLINLSAIPASPALINLAMNLDQVDRIVFVSKSAVSHGMALLDQYWPQWPAALNWYAVGSGTAALLAPWNVQADYPETAGTEGLLALMPLASMSGEHVMIVRGVGGRELLAESLRSAGARVSYLEVYRRDPVMWPDLGELPTDSIVVLTSGEILAHFAGQVMNRISGFHAVVPSPRIADQAKDCGFASVTIAAEASDQALYDVILAIR